MALTAEQKTDRAFYAIAAGVVLVIAALLPLAHAADEAADRKRPMYEDLAQMEWLQYQSVTDTGEAVELELAGGESAEVAGETFTSREGVNVEVRVTDAAAYCVRVSNDDGDVSAWHCLDEEHPPHDPDGPVTAPGASAGR